MNLIIYKRRFSLYAASGSDLGTMYTLACMRFFPAHTEYLGLSADFKPKTFLCTFLDYTERMTFPLKNSLVVSIKSSRCRDGV